MTNHVEVNQLRVDVGPLESPKTIVHDVSFTLKRGEVLALIGESGSGKTTIALSLLGYARPGCRLSSGAVNVGNDNMLALNEKQLADLRGRKVAYVA